MIRVAAEILHAGLHRGISRSAADFHPQQRCWRHRVRICRVPPACIRWRASSTADEHSTGFARDNALENVMAERTGLSVLNHPLKTRRDGERGFQPDRSWLLQRSEQARSIDARKISRAPRNFRGRSAVVSGLSREARGKIRAARNCPRSRERGLDSIVIEFTKNRQIERSLVLHASGVRARMARSDGTNENDHSRRQGLVLGIPSM